ncbi:hypothetical protein MRX96_005130 [Rhipicephalus microplus]
MAPGPIGAAYLLARHVRLRYELWQRECEAPAFARPAFAEASISTRGFASASALFVASMQQLNAPARGWTIALNERWFARRRWRGAWRASPLGRRNKEAPGNFPARAASLLRLLRHPSEAVRTPGRSSADSSPETSDEETLVEEGVVQGRRLV